MIQTQRQNTRAYGRALYRLFLGVTLLTLGCFPTQADDLDGWIFNVMLENDLFSGSDTDQHYTHGTRLSLLSPQGEVPEWVTDGASIVPMFADGGALRVAWSLGQNMYTPADLTDPNPQAEARPYAGWLYGSVGLLADTGRRVDTVELTLGMVGSSSQADDTQKAVHDFIGAQDPKGWHNQLSDEPGFILTYERKWRMLKPLDLMGLEVDFSPHIGGSLGNVHTHLEAGAMARIGARLQRDYGPPRIRPSLPGSDFFRSSRDLGWYTFTGFSGRYVARNIFLDGNSFEDSPSVDKKPIVGDFQVGAALTWARYRLAYTHIFRSEEFDGQTNPDRFGALTLSVRF